MGVSQMAEDEFQRTDIKNTNEVAFPRATPPAFAVRCCIQFEVSGSYAQRLAVHRWTSRL